jgi:rod shape-determining protein MreB
MIGDAVALEHFKNMIKQDLAMDLGTANTLIYIQREGVVLNEPTVIAFSGDGRVIEVGLAAKKYLGRTPKGITAVRPMKDGIIEDFDAISQLIEVFLNRAQERKGIFSPRIVICVPSNITQVEKRAVLEAAQEAGAKKIFLLEETMAAAIGAGLSVHGEEPQMVMDIGGGTTEVAVIAKWSYLHCETLRVAGDEFDEAIVRWLTGERGLVVGLTTAETIKWEIGSVWDDESGLDPEYNVGGKHILQGIPVTALITSRELMPALEKPLYAISKMVEDVLDVLSPGTRALIEANGITLTGGGALLRGIIQFLSLRTGLTFNLTSDPLTTVVKGAGRTIEAFKDYEKVFIN